MLFKLGLYLSSIAATLSISHSLDTKTDPNILVITLDDIGYSDLGSFGAEWDTSNLDRFISHGISMSHHYSGYTDSASRSQLMTGVSAYHTGYGKLGSTFGTSTIGGIPLGTPTSAEYFKQYSNDYSTYYIGTWGLGHSFLEHTPNNRGFDYFYGSYSGKTNIATKTQGITKQLTDPTMLINDDTEYFDFWENNEAVSMNEATMSDSNTLYAEKMSSVIKEASKSGSFLGYLSFVGVATYSQSEYSFDDAIVSYCESRVSASNPERQYACQYMVHLDQQLGKVLDALQSENVWDNTLVVITSDNGGSLAFGACNYPLRGGKNSYFEGNTRSIALVGGGIIPDSKQGTKLRGLMSNVDWLPTLLSVSGIIDADMIKVYNLDGYNMYNYIFNDNGDVYTPPRDHILLDIEMFGTEVYIEERDSHDRQWAWTEYEMYSRKKTSVTMTGLAMIFYDDKGDLMKYYVSNRDDTTTNEDVNYEFNWCLKSNDNKYSNTEYNTGDLRPFSGLYDLSNDISEQTNLLKTINQDTFDEIKDIVKEKADYYISPDYSELSKFLYDSFDCFYNSYNIKAYPAANTGKWGQFLSDSNEFGELLQSECGFGTSHPLYTLHTEKFEFGELCDNTAKVSVYNTRMPLSRANSHIKTHATRESVKAIFDKEFTTEMKDSTHVYSSCAGLEDGKYYVQIEFDDTKPVLTVECSNGYMLIDYSSDNNWKDYFSSWIQFHWQVASPFKSDYADMTEWFLPDSGSGDYNYILSHDCDVCDENSLLQTESLATTYWQSTVTNFCGSADKGVNAADEMWDYQCRNAVFSSGYGGAELIDIWHMTDENGIDRDVLLTKLSTTDAHLGICSSLKKAANYDNFDSQSECAEGSGGEMPVVGLQGKYCVCAKYGGKSSSLLRPNAHKKLLTEGTKKRLDKLRSMKNNKNKINKEIIANDDNDDNDKVFYLYSSDFTSGTYRIQEKGTYILMDDIVFDYNAPDYTNDPDYSANSFSSSSMDLHWYPKQSQKEDYPGAYEFRDPYQLGFFAGITIEVDDVTLDLNDHTIEMDTRYYFQQPFWAHIQIGSQNFIPGKGPAPLGADPQFVSNIVIKNGILGLTSHHCVHGTSPKHSEMTNIVIENLVCKEFTTHGIQLNGFNGLTLRNVEVGPTTDKHLLTSDYSNMRTLLPRFRYFADLYTEETFRFGGKPSKEYLIKNGMDLSQVSLTNDIDYTLADILDVAINQMDMAFDYVMGRKTEEELYGEYGLEWLQAKRVFVYEEQNGVPYGGSMYAVYLNYPGTGITGFYTNNEVSKNVEIDGLYIHDMQHGTLETPCITDHSKSPFGVAVSAQKMVGDVNYFNWANIKDIQKDGEMYYYGTIVYDMFLAFYDIVSRDPMNIDALNMGVFEDATLEWAKTGDYQTSQKWSITCGNDPMFHAVKGMYGLRISGVEGARVSNVKIENMVEMSDLGTDMCGSFVVFSQQQPYMYGYSGNNVHSISVLHSDVLFNNIEITNIESTTGNATALSIYPRSSVVFEGENNDISNIIAGSQFQDENMNYEDLISELGEAQYPNPMPRACAVKADDFDTQEALVSFESMNNFDGTKMSVSCMSGYLDCDQTAVSDESTWSDFGTYNSNDNCKYSLVDNSKESMFSQFVAALNPSNYSLIAQITFIATVAISCVVCYFNQDMFSHCSNKIQGYNRI